MEKKRLLFEVGILVLFSLVIVAATTYTNTPTNFVGHNGDNVWVKVGNEEKTLQLAIDQNFTGSSGIKCQWVSMPTGQMSKSAFDSSGATGLCKFVISSSNTVYGFIDTFPSTSTNVTCSLRQDGVTSVGKTTFYYSCK